MQHFELNKSVSICDVENVFRIDIIIKKKGIDSKLTRWYFRGPKVSLAI